MVSESLEGMRKLSEDAPQVSKDRSSTIVKVADRWRKLIFDRERYSEGHGLRYTLGYGNANDASDSDGEAKQDGKEERKCGWVREEEAATSGITTTTT